MGAQRPVNPDLNGDEAAVSPRQTTEGLLGHRRGTDQTKRIETDDSGNVYVHVASDDTATSVSVSPLVVGAVASVPDSTLTTIATFTAGAPTKITRISCSGTVYAKFQLFKNTVLIETVRSGPDRTIFIQFKAPLSLNTSDILDVKTTHYVVSALESFEATIYGA